MSAGHRNLYRWPMTTFALEQRANRRELLAGPSSLNGWRATANVVLSGAIGFVTMMMVLLGLIFVAAFSWTVVGPMIIGLGLVSLSASASAVQRSRLAAFMNVSIAVPPRPLAAPSWWRQVVLDVRQPSTWRQLTYHFFAGLMCLITASIVISVWAYGLVLSTVFVHGWFWGSGFAMGWSTEVPFGMIASTILGGILLLAAPWVARAAEQLDLMIARPLLGATQAELLSVKVASLSQDRAGVVDAAEAERRRIERDLHDGTQQRLTSLAMGLGMARANLTDLPDSARTAIEDAHDEAKLALVELRAFVRGLHPPVLDDRGLDAALSGLVARSPIPARLDVDLFQRPSPTIEAVAYFVVAESLTNVAKHSTASFVEVIVSRDAEWLSIRITDDGRGGADPDRGTGLKGLQQRIAAVDGRIMIDSPLGGPTHVVVELPCES